jgi:Zn ribbon nucleic-acid-binding protein
MSRPDNRARCPECDQQETVVKAAWWTECCKRLRRRQCQSCGHRWYTVASGEVPIRAGDLDWTHASGHLPRAAQKPRYEGVFEFPVTDWEE